MTEGLANAKQGLIHPNISSESGRINRMFQDVHEVINKHVLGSEFNPTQWECPYDKKEKQIGTITMENTKVRKIVSNFESLIILVITPDRQESWKISVNSYCVSMNIVRSKNDLDHEQIVEFQRYIDLFFRKWVKLHGIGGITNYIHMLGSGHIADYLFRWKKLCRHSQQGWEALNSLIKTFWFQ